MTAFHRQTRIFHTVTILCTCWVCLLFFMACARYTALLCPCSIWYIYMQPSPAVREVSVCCRKSSLRIKPPRFTGPQMVICALNQSKSLSNHRLVHIFTYVTAAEAHCLLMWLKMHFGQASKYHNDYCSDRVMETPDPE